MLCCAEKQGDLRSDSAYLVNPTSIKFANPEVGI